MCCFNCHIRQANEKSQEEKILDAMCKSGSPEVRLQM